MGRRKGSLNKTTKKRKCDKIYPIRLDYDLQEWVETKPNRNAYFNEIIRKDYEEYLKNKEEQA